MIFWNKLTTDLTLFEYMRISSPKIKSLYKIDPWKIKMKKIKNKTRK